MSNAHSYGGNQLECAYCNSEANCFQDEFIFYVEQGARDRVESPPSPASRRARTRWLELDPPRPPPPRRRRRQVVRDLRHLVLQSAHDGSLWAGARTRCHEPRSVSALRVAMCPEVTGAQSVGLLERPILLPRRCLSPPLWSSHRPAHHARPGVGRCRRWQPTHLLARIHRRAAVRLRAGGLLVRARLPGVLCRATRRLPRLLWRVRGRVGLPVRLVGRAGARRCPPEGGVGGWEGWEGGAQEGG